MSAGQPVRRRAPATVNRALAAVSSFYEYLILSEHCKAGQNPMLKQFDWETARVPARHRPFMGRASRQQPIRRVLRVRTIQRVPRPMEAEHVSRLLQDLKLRRDKAMILLMLNGGLRPGEVLNLLSKTPSTTSPEPSRTWPERPRIMCGPSASAAI
jgi:integrase/recombinase XerD